MAGHSKWANIKFRKAAQDAKRGRLFTKLIREITVSARAGGADADANPRLRAAIDKALTANMTRDTIDRAIARGAGDVDGEHYEEVRYEGYAPGGVAVLVECTTDNRNRTVSDVRHAFSKHGGNLGTDGSVAYLFERIGLLVFPAGTSEDALMEAAVSAGATDIEPNDDGTIEVTAAPDEFHAVMRRLADAGFRPEFAELVQRPSSEIEIEGEDAEKVMRLVSVLEDLDDVQDVHTNAVFVDDEVHV
jgi:YebC/PmpR family DNA-binding regulatory protein